MKYIIFIFAAFFSLNLPCFAQDLSGWPAITLAVQPLALKQKTDSELKSLVAGISQKSKDNVDFFFKYHAKFSLEDKVYNSSGHYLLKRGTVEFSIAEKGKYFVSSKDVSVVNPKNPSPEMPMALRHDFISVMTPESWWQLDSRLHGQLQDYPRVKGVSSPPWRSRVATRSKPEAARKELQMGEVFDPRILFQTVQGGFIDQHLPFIITEIESPQVNVGGGPLCYLVHNQQQGELLILESTGTHSSNESDSGSWLKIDVNTGNPIEFTQFIKGKLNTTKTWTYRKVGEGWFPETMTLSFYNGIDSPVGSRRLTLEKIDVNAKEPKFDQSLLKFDFGDRLIDNFDNRLYVYDGTRLVPVEEFDYSAIASKPSSTNGKATTSRLPLLIIMIAVAAILAAAFLVLRYRKR